MKAVELRKKTCCFTGHRDIPIDRTQEIAERTSNEIRRLIVNHDVHFFGVGGAIGYDMLAARVLFRLKETEFPNIKVILVYPFDGFTSRWSPEQKSDHESLLSKYDKVVCVCEKTCVMPKLHKISYKSCGAFFYAHFRHFDEGK